MNELIKELAEEAGYDPFWSTKADREFYFDLHEFAKLIVRKCISKIENEAEQYAAPVWAVELVNDIKETFGVEE